MHPSIMAKRRAVAQQNIINSINKLFKDSGKNPTGRTKELLEILDRPRARDYELLQLMKIEAIAELLNMVSGAGDKKTQISNKKAGKKRKSTRVEQPQNKPGGIASRITDFLSGEDVNPVNAAPASEQTGAQGWDQLQQDDQAENIEGNG